MNPYLALVLIVILATGLALVVARPRYEFVVTVRQGEAHVVSGKVAVLFLQEVRDLCQRNHIKQGWFGGVRRGKRVSLQFGGGFPSGCQQQLRNLWVMQG